MASIVDTIMFITLEALCNAVYKCYTYLLNYFVIVNCVSIQCFCAVDVIGADVL